MAGAELWLTGFVMVGIGSACIWFALTLFAEYRRQATANPPAEFLWTAIRAAPMGAMALVGGTLLGGSGLLLLAFLAATDAAHVWNALLLTLGLR